MGGHRAGQGGRWVGPACAVGPLLFLAVFFAWPVLAILDTGLGAGGRVDFGPVGEVLGDRELRRVLWFTVVQAIASTVLTLVLALPGAWVLARFDFPGRTLVRAAITVPFVLPTVVVGTAFVGLLGARSPINGLLELLPGVSEGPLAFEQGIGAVLLAHVFFNYAIVVRTVGGLWSHIDPRLEEAARALGASPWQAFREVTLPLLRPAIAAAASIVFLFTFTSFGVVLILGGPRWSTIEVEIRRQTQFLFDLPVASALAVIQMIMVGATLVFWSRYQRRTAVRQQLRAAGTVARRPRPGRERWLVGANLIFLLLLLGAPLIVLVERSLVTVDGYGLGNWRALDETRRGSTLFVSPLDAVTNSLVAAVLATVMAVVLGLLAALAVTQWRGRGAATVDALLMLPLGTSAVTVGFGFLVAFDDAPLDFRGSWLLVPIAQALIATPFVVRTLTPVLASMQIRLREAAAVLGAGPLRAWREVDFPIVARALLVAAGFGFAVSIGEFGATNFVARSDRPTVPVAIFRFLGQPGVNNLGQAMALSTILMVLTTVAVLAIERLRDLEGSEF
ncbi:MAG: iron ABC transporter permease [Actinomycetia bacterium]|nr:iron ABC transporter permease [Actinomycetes bacterium]